MSARVCGIVLVLGLSAAPHLGAQAIRGRVFLADSIPAVGIVITAIGANGKTAASALSTRTGDYTLRLATSGRYELRALRIGYRPTVVSGVDVRSGEVRVQNITLTRLPVSIAAMLASDKGDCDLRGKDAERFLQLWEQARGALVATRLSELGGALDVHVVRVSGHVDGVRYFPDLSDSLFAETDSLEARESIADRVFASTPAETLSVAGYVRPRGEDEFVYDMPSAEALLTDDFAARHCFRIEDPPDEHPDWIGVGFYPREMRARVTDIEGVLWLDRASAELRRLEFYYANTPRLDVEVCDPAPWQPPDPDFSLPWPPKNNWGKPVCSRFRNTASNRLGLGGYEDFKRLGSGEWLTTSWMMRTPPDEGRIRKTGIRSRIVNRVAERCYYGKNCHDNLMMRPRLVTTTGTISRVIRDGVEIYRDDGSLALIVAAAPKRAGAHPAHFDGVVTDIDRNPLANAIIQTDDPARVAVTDTAGAFSLRTLPAMPVTVTVRCRGYEPVRFPLPLLADSTRRVTLALVSDTTNTSGSRNCSNAP